MAGQGAHEGFGAKYPGHSRSSSPSPRDPVLPQIPLHVLPGTSPSQHRVSVSGTLNARLGSRAWGAEGAGWLFRALLGSHSLGLAGGRGRHGHASEGLWHAS